jgi:hypothetical protein
MMPKSSRTCEYCGTSYVKKEHYDRHLRTHTREKPFNCTQCTSKFSRRDALTRHFRICHPQEDQENESRIATPGTADADALDVPHSQGPLPPAEQNDYQSVPFHDGHDAPPMQSPRINLPNDFGWQWDDTLNLDPTFSIDDLCSFDPSTFDLSTPWMPLLRSTGDLDVPPLQTSSASVNSPPRSQASPQWFTHIAHPILHPGLWARPSRARTPAATAEGEISRDALASSLVLKQPVPNTALPSAPFLNRCIHTFTTRLWPVIPIIHLPSFKPAQTHPLLLLSICSLGALADGSKQALHYAERLLEGVRKAILVSFSPDTAIDKHSVAALQAGVIGQTFAILSGKAEHLLNAQAFHGALFVVVRKAYSVLSGSRPPEPVPNPPQAKDWDEWITVQTVIRLLNAVYVHNGEIAAIMQQPASQRVQPLMIPVAAPDSLFLAKTSNEWVNLQHTQPSSLLPPRSTFSSCAILECFISEISHARCSPFHAMRDQHIDEYQKALHAWFLESAGPFRNDTVQRFTMLTLWHSCFLLLLCDINLVEKASGRDGDSTSNAETQHLRDWILTPRAKQCVAHAVLLCKLTEDVRIRDVPAAHVARSLWHAGLVLAMYSSLTQNQPSDGLPNAMPERHGGGVEALRRTDFLTESDLDVLKDDATPTRCGTLAFGISTTLRHLGPWPAAACYASTLDQVLNFNESKVL